MDEQLVPGLGRLGVDISISKFKKHKSPGSDQIPIEYLKEGVK
jgi:hypothetical protein